MSDGPMTTASISSPGPIQTPENTTAPHEPSPAQVKKKSTGFTKEMREAKIAAGWIPPEKRQKKVAAEDLHILGVAPMAAPSEQIFAARRLQIVDQLLKALVDKLVALENNEQYRSVWTHYFVHGGVYNGPKYLDELNDAIQYLIGNEVAKNTVGERS